MPQTFVTPQGRKLAYHHSAGTLPGLVFLGGFRSDMTGTKAVHLENWARAQGINFVRFDYSGHGESGGEFVDGCIGDWTEDARAVLDHLTEGPQVLVGSSMGGWIAVLLARAVPTRVHGVVGIAAAPDFTEDSMWPHLTTAQQEQVRTLGQVALPNAYDPTPYVLTRRLFDDGRQHLVLRSPLRLPFSVRLLQGDQDGAVPTDVPLRLMAHADCADMALTLVKGADHRFSTPECLDLITRDVADVLGQGGENDQR